MRIDASDPEYGDLYFTSWRVLSYALATAWVWLAWSVIILLGTIITLRYHTLKVDVGGGAKVRSAGDGRGEGPTPGLHIVPGHFAHYGDCCPSTHAPKGRLFGKGSVRGLAAPETANNAAATGSFVPLLTLGIPGSGTTAIMLGALIGYGIQPGPRLYLDQPDVFWSVIVSMWIGNVILLVLNLPLIPYIARVLSIPSRFLLPLILFFSLIGVYFVSFNTFDIQLMVLFAVVAVTLRILDFPMAPMLLGFILGGMMEENLRRALLINDGSWDFLWTRPLTLTILIIASLCLVAPIVLGWLRREPAEAARTDASAD